LIKNSEIQIEEYEVLKAYKTVPEIHRSKYSKDI